MLPFITFDKLASHMIRSIDRCAPVDPRVRQLPPLATVVFIAFNLIWSWHGQCFFLQYVQIVLAGEGVMVSSREWLTRIGSMNTTRGILPCLGFKAHFPSGFIRIKLQETLRTRKLI